MKDLLYKISTFLFLSKARFIKDINELKQTKGRKRIDDTREGTHTSLEADPFIVKTHEG